MSRIGSLAAGIALSAAGSHVQAADGCTVLLCLAGPWTQIEQCVPPVNETFRDLALGKPFPACEMSGEGNSAGNTWTDQMNCPEMYSVYHPPSGDWLRCTYRGLISVTINGQPWSDMFWDSRGRSSTRYTDYTRQQLGDEYLDPTYDQDLAAWEAMHPDPPPDGGGGEG